MDWEREGNEGGDEGLEDSTSNVLERRSVGVPDLSGGGAVGGKRGSIGASLFVLDLGRAGGKPEGAFSTLGEIGLYGSYSSLRKSAGERP